LAREAGSASHIGSRRELSHTLSASTFLIFITHETQPVAMNTY
jgi:hypothetical protein